MIAGGHAFHEVPVVAGEDHRALVVEQRFGQRFDRVDVQMVARLVEHQHVVLAQQQAGQAQPGPLAAGEHRDSLLHLLAAEQQGAGQVENRLVLGARRGVVLQIFEHAFAFRAGSCKRAGRRRRSGSRSPSGLRRPAA